MSKKEITVLSESAYRAVETSKLTTDELLLIIKIHLLMNSLSPEGISVYEEISSRIHIPEQNDREQVLLGIQQLVRSK